MLMIIGSRLIFCKDIESTNTYASGLLQSESVAEGTIIYTNYQSAGRGQKGNRWESEYGKNLLFSTVLYPIMIRPEDQFIISIFVSLGICDFLKILKQGCKIKWPNDIYAGDDKIAGILIENTIISNAILNSIAGIGLNINQEEFPEGLPNPVSIKNLTGKEFDPDYCLKQLSVCLDLRYKQVISGNWDALRHEYISSLYQLNTWRSFRSEKGILEGRIVSVTNAGYLKIEEKSGNIREFAFKEIEFGI
jgi:BirA family transcriptional regulator, biotin operon repressor / biotin---[acetyl-CoA-carboxylase] ligase